MTKRIVLAFGLTEKKIDPQFCDHANAFTAHEYGETWLVCPDCNARIFEDGETQRLGDSVPIWKGDL